MISRACPREGLVILLIRLILWFIIIVIVIVWLGADANLVERAVIGRRCPQS
jgi:riboflavin transporter FmnP